MTEFKAVSVMTNRTVPCSIFKETKCFITYKVHNYYGEGRHTFQRVRKGNTYLTDISMLVMVNG